MKTISGTPVSRFSFGTMQFGGKADAAASGEMFAACRDAGINFFDTAFAYNGGASEVALGKLAAGARDDLFIATKTANQKTATPEVIHSEFGESRKRLGMETVDLLYIHQPDPVTPIEVSLEALRGYVEAGAVRYVGVSNFSAWATMKARQAARDMGIDLTFLQPMYNLVKRQAEVEILPMAISEGFYVCPYSPLGGGLLTGKYAAGDGGRIKDDPMYAVRYAPEWMHEAAAGLKALSDEAGVHPATLAVAFVARHQGTWGPIISARSAEQLAPSLAAMDFEMDDALYVRIAGLTPAPPPANDRLEEA
ncbi:MAG: aldo/keto reductase [Silicimonas sp.]|nr:aldo/keto reductase [Silicimonas sp.]